MKTKKKMTVGRAALYIIVYIAALFWIFPVIWMLVSSLKPYGTPVSILSKVLTGVFSLDNYAVVAKKAQSSNGFSTVRPLPLQLP